MKIVLLAVFALLGANASAADLRINGEAAVEMYAKLKIKEVKVADEHGGEAFAVAKFGKDIGCQKRLGNENSVECWANQERTAQPGNLLLTGAAATELYDGLNIAEVQVPDEHGGNAFATAKYGKLLGCQKSLYDGKTCECWINQ